MTCKLDISNYVYVHVIRRVCLKIRPGQNEIYLACLSFVHLCIRRPVFPTTQLESGNWVALSLFANRKFDVNSNYFFLRVGQIRYQDETH